MLSRYAQEPRPIVLVLDNYRTHSSEITLSGLAPCKDRLSAFFLPTYSPHLYIIELLWKHLRRVVTHNRLFENVEALINAMNRQTSATLSVVGATQ